MDALHIHLLDLHKVAIIILVYLIKGNYHWNKFYISVQRPRTGNVSGTKMSNLFAVLCRCNDEML